MSLKANYLDRRPDDMFGLKHIQYAKKITAYPLGTKELELFANVKLQHDLANFGKIKTICKKNIKLEQN